MLLLTRRFFGRKSERIFTLDNGVECAIIKTRRGTTDRRLPLKVSLRNNRFVGTIGGYFFFIVETTRVITAVSTRTKENSSSYVTNIGVTPFRGR